MFLIELCLFREVKTSTPFLLHFYFSGVQENKSEFIDIPAELYWLVRDNIRETFVRSGFADRLAEYKLLPCPLGTFVDGSLTDPNCKNCSAGKL